MRSYTGKITERELHPSLLEHLVKKTNDNIYAYRGQVVIDRPTNIIKIPIDKFNASNDILWVHKNGTLLKEDFDFTFDLNRTSIIKTDDKWNTYVGQKTTFDFIVIKNIKKYTKLSNIEIQNGSVNIEKLHKDLVKGLVPPGGHKGSYLIKKSNSDYHYEWLDFTSYTISLRSQTGDVIEDTLVKIVDEYTSKEYIYNITGGVITITDLPMGGFKVYVFANRGFRPELSEYEINIEPNVANQLIVNMIERDHEIQLEVASDVEIENPSVLITNTYTNDEYRFELTGMGTSISKLISLKSGTYKAVVLDNGSGLKQINDIIFTLDSSHSLSNVTINVVNQYRVCNIDLKFKPVLYAEENLSRFLPAFTEDSIDLLDSYDLTEINKKDEFEIDVEIINLNTAATVHERIKVPKRGINRNIQVFLENNIAYRLRINIDGEFSINGKVAEIEAGSLEFNHTCEIFEEYGLIKFVPQVDNTRLFSGVRGTERKYYNIEIYKSDNGAFNNHSLYKVINNINPDTIIKVDSGENNYYRIKIKPDSKLNTYISGIVKVPTVKLEVGANIFNPDNIVNIVSKYTPIIEYGFRIDPENSDPNAAVTYIGDCENFMPVRTVTGNIDLGSWGNTFITNSATPVVLTDGNVTQELSKDNQSLQFNRINGNEDFKGDLMVRFEKCYYTFKEYLNGVIEFKICTIKKGPEYDCFAFKDFTGNEKQFMYYGMYESSFDGNTLRSLPNKDVKTEMGMRDMYSLISAKGLGYSLEDYSKRLYLVCLNTLLSKSIDSQTVFGYGNSDSIDINKTGLSETLPMFYGDESKVKTFFIENLWGNTENWLQGLVYSDGSFRVKQYGPYSSNPLDYYITDVTVNPTDNSVPNNNIIKKCTAGSFGFLPQITNANVNYYNDFGYISPNFPIPTVGGSHISRNGAGLWSMNVYYSWNEGTNKISGRIVYV